MLSGAIRALFWEHFIKQIYDSLIWKTGKIFSGSTHNLNFISGRKSNSSIGNNKSRIAIWWISGDTWLNRGKYGIYVAVRGSYVALTGI